MFITALFKQNPVLKPNIAVMHLRGWTVMAGVASSDCLNNFDFVSWFLILIKFPVDGGNCLVLQKFGPLSLLAQSHLSILRNMF